MGERSNFTLSPMKDNPDAGFYDGAHKPFGSELKGKMTIGGKYDWKPDNNPPPGLYDVDGAMAVTK